MKYSNTRITGVLLNGDGDGKFSPLPYPDPQAPILEWARPVEWLALPELQPGDNKFVGLFAVEDNQDIHHSLAANVSGTAEFTVDWGDGSSQNHTGVSSVTHTYDFAALPAQSLLPDGRKQVIVTVTPVPGNQLNVIYPIFNPGAQYSLYRNIGQGWLDIAVASTGLSGVPNFYNRPQRLERIRIIGTTAITSLAGAFQSCVSLRVVEMDSSSVTDFSNAFNSCTALLRGPALNTSNGVNFESMFRACSALRSIPLYDTSKGTNFTAMFILCRALETIPLLDVSAGQNFNTMFSSSGIIELPALNYAAATNCSEMFSGCYNLRYVPPMATPLLQTVSTMFQSCNGLQVAPQIDTHLVTDFSSMFSYCTGLVEIAAYDTSSGLNFSFMFRNCPNLVTPSLFDLSKATNVSSMFTGCKSLKKVPAYNTLKATNFSSMFYECISLEEWPQLNFSAGVDFSSMFNFCYALTQVPDVTFPAGVTFNSMFKNAAIARVGTITMPAGKDLSGMFNTCSFLSEIDAISAPVATNLSNMFAFCYRLTKTPIMDLTGIVGSAAYLFRQCTGLTEVRLTGDSSGITSFVGIIDSSSWVREFPALNMAGATVGGAFAANAQHLSRVLATGMRYSMSVENTSMGVEALVELFTNLGVAAASQSVTITGTPGATLLSSEQRAIATAKGWVVSG